MLIFVITNLATNRFYNDHFKNITQHTIPVQYQIQYKSELFLLEIKINV